MCVVLAEPSEVLVCCSVLSFLAPPVSCRFLSTDIGDAANNTFFFSFYLIPGGGGGFLCSKGSL